MLHTPSCLGNRLSTGTAGDQLPLPGPGQTSWQGGRSSIGPNPQKEEADSSFQLRSLKLGVLPCPSPVPMLTTTSHQRGWAEDKPSPLPKHSPSSTPYGGLASPHAAPHTIWMPSSSAVFCSLSMTFSSSSAARGAVPCSSEAVLAIT